MTRPIDGKDITAIRIRPLRRNDWPHIETLFGSKGACGGCWCMSWRLPRHGKLWEASKGEKNRKAFRALVETGTARGLLAFDGRTPIAWCSLGPRDDFPRIDNSPSLNIDMPEQSWVVSCFFIAPAWRGRGLGERLLKEAVAYAETKKAAALFGFPAPPTAAGKLPAAFAWTGVPAMYRHAGFRAIRNRQYSRPVFRKLFR